MFKNKSLFINIFRKSVEFSKPQPKSWRWTCYLRSNHSASDFNSRRVNTRAEIERPISFCAPEKSLRVRGQPYTKPKLFLFPAHSSCIRSCPPLDVRTAIVSDSRLRGGLVASACQLREIYFLPKSVHNDAQNMRGMRQDNLIPWK